MRKREVFRTNKMLEQILTPNPLPKFFRRGFVSVLQPFQNLQNISLVITTLNICLFKYHKVLVCTASFIDPQLS